MHRIKSFCSYLYVLKSASTFVLVFILFTSISSYSEPVKQIDTSTPDQELTLEEFENPSQSMPPILSPKELQQSIQNELKEAEAEIRKRNFKLASQIYWKNINHLKKRELLFLARCHQHLEEWSEMAKAANLVLAAHPGDHEALTYLGESFLKRGQLDSAKNNYTKALAINPKYLPAYEGLARVYEKNLYEKRLLYLDMIKHLGRRIEFIEVLCEVNLQDGANDDATKFCEEAIRLNPENPINHIHKGLIAKNLGEKVTAKNLLKNAADKFGKSERAQFEYAQFAESEKSNLDALKYYEYCLLINNTSESCLVGFGNMAVQTQRYEEAYNSLKEACRIYGRKHTPHVRRSAHLIRDRGESQWMNRFNSLADSCAVL